MNVPSFILSFPGKSFKKLSFDIQYQPFRSRVLLFNVVFSATISGIITSIDIYLDNFEVAFWIMIGMYLINTILVMVGLTVFGYPIILLLKEINKKLPWTTYRFRRVMVDIALIIAISIVSAVIFGLLVKERGNLNSSVINTLSSYFTFSFIACMTFILIVEAIVFFNERQTLRNKNELLLQENLEARYEVLKNQINPHFLFNNLNVLSSLVYQDPKMADRFIVEFSNIYRYILDMQSKMLVRFEKELEFLDSYIYLLKQRFHDGIIIEKHITQKYLERKVPPLTLQLLMENVVKHNIISPENPLTVYLAEGKDVFIVKNKIALRNQAKVTSGIGLKNIKERYSLVSSRTLNISDENGYFEVTIPLLKID